MTRWTFPLVLALLSACDGGTKGGDTADTGTDTGDTNVEDTYADGCITVDGAGGYLYIADAVAVASEGSVIQLCAGTYEEAVVLDKAVTLAGGDGVILAGPANEVPLTLTAGATAQDLVLQSTRTGIRIEDATGARLSNITVESAASWGLSIAQSPDVAIEGLTLVEPQGGGVEVRGSTVSIDGASLTMPVGFAFDLKNSDVTIANATVDGVVMLTDDVTDGIGVMLEGGSLSLEETTFLMVPGIGIQADGSAITMRGATFTSVGYLALFAFSTDLDAERFVVTDPLLQGMYVTGGSMRLVDSSFSTTPEGSVELLYEEWGTNGNPWGGGVLAAADVLELENVSVSGFNNYGVLLQPNNEDVATLTWTGGTLTNVGRWGTYILGATGTVADLSVSGTREPELADPCGVSNIVNVSNAVLTSGAQDLAFTNLSTTDNGGFGFMAVQGTHSIQGSTFARNTCSGLFEFQGATTVTESTFEGNAPMASQWGGGVYVYESVATLTGNTFNGAHTTSVFEYSDGTNTYRYEYSGYGRDVVGYTPASLTVQGNTFTDGDGSIEVQGGRATVTDNVWSDYDGDLFISFEGDDARPHTFARNAADDIGGYVARAYYGALEVEDVEVGSTRTRTVSYAGYTNGEEDYSYSYESISPAFGGYGYYYDDGAGTVYDMQASLVLNGVTLADAYAQAISTTDTVLVIDDVTIERAGVEYGADAVYANWSDYPVAFEARGLTIRESGGDGVELYNTNAEEGYASLESSEIGTTAYAAVTARGIHHLDLLEVTAIAPGTYGLDVAQLVSYYDSSTGTTVTAPIPGDVGITGFTQEGGAAGVRVVGAPLAMELSAIGAVTGACVDVSGGATVDLYDIACAGSGDTAVTIDEDTSYTDSTGTLVEVDADTVTHLSYVEIANAVTAVAVDGGSTTVSHLTVDGTCTDGLRLSDTTSEVTDSTLRNLSGYGMVCETDVSFGTCSTNDLSGNALGAVSGCPESCGS